MKLWSINESLIMRISADCIDEEHEDTNERLLSETFSRMALNDCNFNQNNNQTLNGQQVRVIYRFCSPPEDYDIQRDGFIPLTVIPIVDNNFDDGYYSNWDEVKNQVFIHLFNQLFAFINWIGINVKLFKYWWIDPKSELQRLQSNSENN